MEKQKQGGGDYEVETNYLTNTHQLTLPHYITHPLALFYPTPFSLLSHLTYISTNSPLLTFDSLLDLCSNRMLSAMESAAVLRSFDCNLLSLFICCWHVWIRVFRKTVCIMHLCVWMFTSWSDHCEANALSSILACVSWFSRLEVVL